MLMLHFVSRLRSAWTFQATASPAGLVRTWPAAAVGALFLPYLVFPFVGGFGEAFALSKLWDGLWPILAGGILALALARLGDRIPHIPTGDTIVLGEAAFGRSLRLGALFDRLDAVFRGWPAADFALVAIALALAYVT